MKIPTNIEAKVWGALTRLGTIAAPVPSAYFVAHASMEHLNAPWWVAGAIAIAMELSGVRLSDTALMFYRWNRMRDNRAKQWQAPTGIPVALFGVYLIATWLLTVLLKVWPDLAQYAPGVFPVLSLSALVNQALNVSHEYRVSTRQKAARKTADEDAARLRKENKRLKEEADLQAEEARRMQEEMERQAEEVPEVAALSPVMTEYAARLREHFPADFRFGSKQVAVALGMSQRRARDVIAALVQAEEIGSAGQFEYRFNGH